METRSIEEGGGRYRSAPGATRGLDRGLLLSALLAGVAIRVLPAWRAVFGGPATQFLGTDSYYHLRRVQYAVHHFPTILDVDPYVNFPEGAEIYWPHGFDLLLATFSKLLIHPATPAVVERLSALIIPLLGVIAIVALYALGRATLPRPGGGMAALTFAFLPYPVTYSLLGYVDHHVMEPFFLALSAALLFTAWTRKRREAAILGGLAGTIASLSFWFVTDGAVIVGLVCGLAVWEGMRARFDGARGAGLSSVVAATITLLLLVRGSPWGRGAMTYLALSRFHAHLAVAGAGLALSLIAGGWRGIGWRRRTLGAAAGVALAVAALLHGGSALLGPIRDSGRFVARAEGIGETTREMNPIWEQPPMKIVAVLTPLGTLIPVFLVVAVIRERRRAAGSAALLGVGALALGAAQLRFMVIGGVGIAWAVGWLAAKAWGATDERVGSGRFRIPAFCAIVAGVVPLSLFIFGRPAGVPDLTPSPQDVALADALRARRQVAGGLDQVRPRLEWGVAARWDVGHLLIYRGEAPVVACPFGLGSAHVEGIQRVVKLSLSDSDAAAADLCGRLRVRYVVTSDPFTRIVDDALTAGVPPARYVIAFSRAKGRVEYTINFLRTTAFRLHALDGAFLSLSGLEIPAMPSFRLVWESRETVPVVPLAGLPAGPPPSTNKLFEVVKGARVEGTCVPGRAVELEVAVRTNRGRTFDWRNRMPCAASGRYAVRTPYASRAVKVGQEGREKTLAITEAQIERGEAVIADLR